MRDTTPTAPLAATRSPQPASPAVLNMDDSLNDTKDSRRRTDTEESMLESSSAVSEQLQESGSLHDSDVEPMDISAKTATSVDSDNASECGDTKYFCPICDLTLTSQHEFTLHIRSHNNDNAPAATDKGFTCRICAKVLSSSSSLDRHVLVHSGERPFRCRVCALTFTTNGNMHRHMRTHQHRPDNNYESDASTDSNASGHSAGKTRKARRLEYNNNNKLVDNNSNKRKSDCFINEDDDNYTNRRKTKHFNNNNNINELNVQKYHCPVCDREDFASLNVLETHLEDNHPDFEARCVSCNLSFKNHRALNLHRFMVHHSEQLNNINNKNVKNAHIGFKDLTFIDFSSEKFPLIARSACEKSLHKPVTEQKFVCEKCTLAFPCASALQMHQSACLHKNVNDLSNPTDLSFKSTTSEEEIRRDNFFSHLDLQNKSAPSSPNSSVNNEPEEPKHRIETKPPIDSKDLADIQSILSMTSNGSLLQQFRPKIPSELPHESIRTPEQHNEEESQDVFAAEFRKMKLRGEFPCRLCSAVFPNLRALKGHNRAHLTGSGSTGPYRCNMCPHSSVDKAALIRHMRTHNGDRPYECSLCNYAFTTKANCERHLRNRHAKITREEVKKSIIYHPSEDPTNDEVNRLGVGRNDLKHSFLNSSNDEDLHVPDRMNSSTPKERGTPELRNILPPPLGITIPSTLITKDLAFNRPGVKEHASLLQINKDLVMFKEQGILPKEEIKGFPFKSAFNFSPALSDKSNEDLVQPKIQVKNLDGLKQIPDYDTHSEGDESSNNMSSSFEDYLKSTERPIDLSMDVLDLSKKKESPSPKTDEPQDFTKKTLESSVQTPPSPSALLLAQQLLKHPYVNHFSQLYQNPALFSNLPGLNMATNPYPYLFPNPFINPQEIKERMLRLQLSGGTMISDQFASLTPNGLQAFHQQAMSNIPDLKFPMPKQDDEIKPPLHINTQLGDSAAKLQSPKPQQKTPDIIHSPNSVKMVIKNGVLMPKQKQRRYRTERPFSCEHCSARFTLRSNMERHIKQQHPQFWSQRQRSGMSGAGRKPTSTPPATMHGNVKTPFYDLNIPNYDMHMPKMQDSIVNETKDKDLSINSTHNIPISKQVKFAILAQQLKAHSGEQIHSPAVKTAQDDDEDALVIDEENEAPKHETKDVSNEAKISEVEAKSKYLNDKMLELRQLREKELKNSEMYQEKKEKMPKAEEAGQDLVPVSRLLDNAVSSQLPFREYFRREGDDNEVEGVSEEDEEGLVASGSTSEGNGSGSDENKSENEATSTNDQGKKKSAYSLAPNRVSCPYCHRKFPWTSSLRRHVLTHTGQKPFKCPQCPLLFTTKSNCDRHLLRKHGNTTHADPANNNNNNNSSASQNYMMRNVPERPHKCPSCPSSTFSTLSNLKKHISCKHTNHEDARPPSAEYESLASSEDERATKQLVDSKSDWENQISHSKIPVPVTDQSIQNADLPFKCHLCDSSYAERQDALDHIKESHVAEFELLMAKGALEQNASEESQAQMHHEAGTEEDEQLRGRFPDYANRKVMCAFCMRRFWSAEDLRRHMRTHTGERPFSCDVCSRKFTLKHSMLRHRKKHTLPLEDGVLASGDEDMPCAPHHNNNNNEGRKKPTGDKSSEDDSEGTEGNDLIGNLLGIRDKSIIDQVLVSSADDAAKLLGVNSGRE